MPLGPIIEGIKGEFGDKVQLDVPMANKTTFKIGGSADLLFSPEDVSDLVRMFQLCKGHDVPITIIGFGSNLLVADGGIRGITIRMTKGFRRIEQKASGENVFLECGASLLLFEIIDYCIDNNIEGFEFASGIPGTLGGAVKGNAGTKEGNVGNVIKEISLVTFNGRHSKLPREKLTFRYRGLESNERIIITNVVLALRAGDGEKVRIKRDKIIAWRLAKQPYHFPSAGSVFKNPEEAPAGRLIEQAGCKGWTVGGAQVSELHTNFIVNNGGATSADVLELIDKVRRRVFENSNILLETEIQVVGEGK